MEVILEAREDISLKSLCGNSEVVRITIGDNASVDASIKELRAALQAIETAESAN